MNSDGLSEADLEWFLSLDATEQSEFVDLLEQAVGEEWELAPKQQYAETLWHKCDWMLYGGAAGGGKTELMIKHINDLSVKVPGHSTLIVRQSIPELRRSIILRLKARIVQFQIPAKLRKVDGVSSFQYDNDSLIECGYLATDEHVANYLCFHPSHELLTEAGWRPVADIAQWDLVATVDPTTNEMWYEPVTQTHEYEYDGELVEVDQKNGVSMCVTPNHTVWCRTKDIPVPRPFRADSIPASARIPRTARWGRQRMPHDFEFTSDGNNGRTVTFDAKTFAEFLGWFASEGSTDPHRWAIRIHQQKPTGKAAVENLLDRMGVNWHFSAGAYSFNNKALCLYLREHVGTHSGSKKLPSHLVRWFPAELLDIFLDAYTDGDGTRYRGDTYRIIVTSSPRMADDLSHVAFKAGWRVTSAEQPKVAFNGYCGQGPMYRVYLSKAKPGEGQVRPEAVRRVAYKGPVYCVTVPPHNTLVTRRNGRVHWTGNSAEYGCIAIDESTLMTFDQIIQLSSRLRVTKRMARAGARPHLGLFSNPGGQSHSQHYELFVTLTGYGTKVVVIDISSGIENAVVVREYPTPHPVDDATDAQMADLNKWAEDLVVEVDPRNELVIAFVPAKAGDNQYIDPSYMKYLNALPERRRKQLRDGNWDTFEGQYFHEWSRDLHIVPWFEIPEGWHHARGADFGSAAPWACLFGAWDNDGNCYLYDECYGAGLTPAQQARDAKEKQTRVLANGKTAKINYFASLADPSVFADKRGTGKSIADLWRDNGFNVNRAKNARIAGWQNVRQYLYDDVEKKPRLYVLEGTCPNLVRTFPLQQHDKKKNEDLQTTLEDHAVDALRYLLSARPIGARLPPNKNGLTIQERFSNKIRGMDRRPRARLFG